jgi:glutaminyl-tRNA synthetase
MAVLRPLKVTLTNYPAEQTEWLDAPYWPRDIDKEGLRQVPLAREVYIEQTDFSEQPPEGWTRLRPGGEVRLRNAYFIRCDEVVKDPATGAVVELRCTYDPDSLGKTVGKERKQSTAIQWVSAEHAVPAEVRLYDRLLTIADPDDVEAGESFLDYLNPRSLEVLTGSLVEPGLAQTAAGERFQFVRHGYFIADAEDSQPGALVFNRIVELPDSFSKALQKQANAAAGAAKTAPKEAPKAKAETGSVSTVSAGAASAAFATGSLSDERARARSANTLLAQRHDYYLDVLGLTPELADVLTGDEAVARFYDAALAVHNNPKAIANWIANEVLRELKGKPLEQLPFTAVQLAELVKLLDQGTITSAGAKSVFAAMLAAAAPAEASPAAIVRRLGLDQALSAAELATAVDQVLAALPGKVAEYRAGKTSLLGMFTGQVIKATGGKASPQAVQEILKDRLA